MKKIFMLLSIILIGLAGCGTGDSGEESQKTQLEEPPSLTVRVGEHEFKALEGGYDWEIDHGDGTSTGFHADAASPPQMVKSEAMIKVKSDNKIDLTFEVDPERFDVYIWDDEGVTESRVDLDLAKRSGPNIFEVVATWDQGQASYAFKLDIE